MKRTAIVLRRVILVSVEKLLGVAILQEQTVARKERLHTGFQGVLSPWHLSSLHC